MYPVIKLIRTAKMNQTLNNTLYAHHFISDNDESDFGIDRSEFCSGNILLTLICGQ